MVKNRNKSKLVVVVIVLVAFGLLGGGNLVSLFTTGSARTIEDVVKSCTLDMYTTFHIHPRVRIIVNGQEQTIPSNIGVAPGCMHPLHTHDAVGTIHVESPEPRDFTLHHFFMVWEKPFNREQILDYRTDAEHEIVMTVDGAVNTEFENLVLRDKQEIVIEYRKVVSTSDK